MRSMATLLLATALIATGATAQTTPPRHDLPEIQAAGQLRHLGLPYAKFVTGAGDGLDVELVRLFCREIGVQYVYVETDWDRSIADVTGLAFTRDGDDVTITGSTEVRGDLIAHGLTVLAWRQELLHFSEPLFPTQTWLIAPASSSLAPIASTGSMAGDIAVTYRLVNGVSVLAKPGGFLDPKLYELADHGALVVNYEGRLDHMAPNLLGGMADLTILDVPDALVALQRWQGKLRVLGPLTEPQVVAAAFPKNSPKLEAAFGAFLGRCRADGTYESLVRKHYPGVWAYFPDFFGGGGSVQ